MNANKILKKIELLKNELEAISSMRRGSLSQQYNVCGSPGCKCKDPVSPKKHGPYFKLNINIKGKSTTKFIKNENVPQVKKQIEEYKKFNCLIADWVSLANELADLEITMSSEGKLKSKKR
jgi:hypothetical protein